ncbi:TonB-dependent siderophore receptor [Kozakia baliensis]|uniref:TonB-dependent siderophore receptor n=1 Tax=Kozakia baliensis TaxID=153496 RepID=UPI00087A5668|nr:TonB-dependent siderophore receptor [Kozakia baliensis]AOX20058.1 TonB-dependent receptor [Kozakia baliensis]
MTRTTIRAFRRIPGFRAALLSALTPLAAYAAPVTSPDVDTKKNLPQIKPGRETVTVHGATRAPRLAHKVPLGALGTRSELDTPFSIASVSAARIQKMQAADINDVFRYEPGVQENSNGGSTASGSSFRVRGLNLDWTNGYKIDGLAIPYWYIDIPLANIDRLQLIKGASAFMYGFGSPGGVLDYQLKAPVEERQLGVEAGYRSDSVFRQMLDVGGSLDDGHRIATRLSFGSEVGNQYNDSFVRNLSMSFTTRAKITDTLHWNFNSFYMNTLQKGMVNGVAVANDVTNVRTISGRAPFGAEDSWKTNDLKRFSTGFDWDISPNWSANIVYGYTHLDERFPSNQLTFTSDNGNYYNQSFQMTRVLTYHQVNASTEGHFRTGFLQHDVNVGVTWLKQIFDADAGAGAFGSREYGNIHTMRPFLTTATNYDPRLYHYIDYLQVAPYWTDTMTWRKWSLMAGARYTDYQENDFLASGSRTAAHRNNPVTPIVSLSYKPQDSINVYFSYVESMQSGGQAGSTNVNYMEVFAPIRSQEYELGVKVQKRRWSGTLALYRLDTGAAYTNAQNYYVQDGLSRYQGVEASGGWQATHDLTFGGSITYLDARYVKAAAGYAGRRLEAVAPFQAAFNADYLIRPVKGLSVNAGFNYVSASWLDAANTFRLPSYIVGNVGGNYVTRIGNHRLTLRASVQNIGNVRYWVSRGNRGLFPGAPRTATLSARFDL